MVSVPSDLLGLELQARNDNAGVWDVNANRLMEMIEQSIAKEISISSTGGTTALTQSGVDVTAYDEDQSRCPFIRVSASQTLISNVIVTTARARDYLVSNESTSGAFTVQFGGNALNLVTIPRGCAVRVRVLPTTGATYIVGPAMVLATGKVDVTSLNILSNNAELTVASATTANILGADSEFIAISGTTTITSFGTGASQKRLVRATGAFKITHNATSLICPGGQDIIAAAGDTFQVVSDASSNARVHNYQRAAVPPQAVPLGAVMDYAGVTAPAFWLFCYGQSLLRTDYPGLFAALSTTYGAADGTHFTLPDLRGRVVAGQDDMGGSSANRLTGQSNGVDGDTLGAAGGAETHTLFTAESGQKAITAAAVDITDPGHAHSVKNTLFGQYDTPGSKSAVDTISSSGSTTSAAAAIANTTGIIAAFTLSGSSAASGHNNVQPTFILNKIIFAGV